MAISGVSMTVKRTGHWASHGVTYNNGFSSDICTVTITNDNTCPVEINSITLPVGTGKGTVYGEVWKNGVKTIDAFTVTGAACAAKIINSSNKSLFSANVTTNVTVSKTGSTSASGYFNNPSGGTTFTGSLTLAKNSSITLGVGVNGGSGSTSGPILSCDNGYSDGDNDNKQISRNIGITGRLAQCDISNPTISPAVIIPGGTVTASVTNDGSTLSYQWYNSNGTAIPNATGASHKAENGDYCVITATWPNWASDSETTPAVKHYGQPTKPTGLTITGSKDDGRYTNKENYTFTWAASTNGANGNTVTGYKYWISNENSNDESKAFIGETTSTARTVTKTSAELVSKFNLKKGSIIYFWVQALGSAGYNSDWSIVKTANITSAAVMHVKNGSAWSEGIVYVNTGTSSAPNWVEATEVKIKDGTQWKDSI